MTSTSANGQIFICSSCKRIHFEFGTVSMDFKGRQQLKYFLKYLNNINGPYFESLNNNNLCRRKIQIPFPGSPLKMVLTIGELQELRHLIKSFLQKSHPSSRKENCGQIMNIIKIPSLLNTTLN